MKKIIALIVIASCFISVKAQEQIKKAWEAGLQFSAYQFNRVNNLTVTETPEGGSDIKLQLKHVAYAGGLYGAKELNKNGTIVVDFQGGLGKIDNDWFSDLGVGLQYRFGYIFSKPYSPVIDPYIRIGASYFQKGKNIIYNGEEQGIKWGMWNVNNEDGADAYHVAMGSIGIGSNFWLNERIGFAIEGKYDQMLHNKMANTIQGTVRVMFRIGKNVRTKKPSEQYVTEYVYVDREVIKEKIKIDTVNIETEKKVTVNKLIAAITFDFNSYEIHERYYGALNFIAEYMQADINRKYLISGYTDIKGNPEYNERLSLLRVNAIKNALVNLGVPESMIKVRGNGSKIAYMPASASDDVRAFDRKTNLEEVFDLEQWENL